jgi:hypothetical protein
MDKKEKKQYLDQLAENNLFQVGLESASSEEEKKKIKAFAEDVFLNIIEGMLKAKKAFDQNPEKVVEVIAKRISKE